MSKITVEIDDKYREHLDILKQALPASVGTPITEDGAMLETLIDTFMAFVHAQAEHAHGGDGCCGGGGHGEGDEGGCGCSH